MKVTSGLRLHIGFFGKRNAGKSTIVNRIIGRDLSIVSEIKGTTTDVNSKAMELLPIGPVVLLDTAGFDDIDDELGKKRVEKTKLALQRTDVCVFVADNEKLSDIEKDFLKNVKNTKIISIINKGDIGKIDEESFDFLKENSDIVIETGLGDGEKFIFDFKRALIKILPEDFINQKAILSDIVKPREICLLVIPIDKEAPKGRIILPQVNVLREMLDYGSISVVCTENELESALLCLKTKPKLVVCDSQVFKKVSQTVPLDIMLTSFSILFARLKGDLGEFISGADKIDKLSDNDNILILESCSHHPVEDDIGRVKIPKLLMKYTNKKLNFEHFSGHSFPEDIKKYSLIVHCGACMTNRKEVLNRIEIAKENNVKITNYGILIAKCNGILKRATKMFTY